MQAGSYFVMCTYALTLYFWHAPYLRDSINILEAGLSAILVWISGMLFLLELITGSEGANSNAAQPISLACAAGIIPSFFAGGITMWLRWGLQQA